MVGRLQTKKGRVEGDEGQNGNGISGEVRAIVSNQVAVNVER